MGEVITAPQQAADEQTPIPDERAAGEPPRLRQLMGRYTGPRDLDGQLRLAARLSTAKRTIPWQYRDNEGDLLALIQHAIALDIELMVALDNLHFNQAGVGGMRARLMHALVLRAGHKIEPLHVDNLRVRMRLTRGDSKPGAHALWTIAEAQAAGLIKADKDCSWRNYPGDMLWARGISRVTRRGAPEVILGFYEVSELDAILPDDIDPVDLSTAVSDVDGNLLPAPDVERLLQGLDTADSEDIRQRWRIAREEGLLGAFGGMVGDVHHSVEEILFDWGTAAEELEQAERKQARKQNGRPAGEQEGKQERLPSGKPAGKQDGGERDFFPTLVDGEQRVPLDPANNRFYREPEPQGQVPAEQAPAGQGDRLNCGCTPATVLKGDHEEGCLL